MSIVGIMHAARVLIAQAPPKTVTYCTCERPHNRDWSYTILSPDSCFHTFWCFPVGLRSIICVRVQEN